MLNKKEHKWIIFSIVTKKYSILKVSRTYVEKKSVIWNLKSLFLKCNFYTFTGSSKVFSRHDYIENTKLTKKMLVLKLVL